ncbi:hypothetical protein GVAV_001257 [Gurleya vavrai]
MFFSFVKFLIFQYNQVAYSLIDFGVLDDIEDKKSIMRKLAIIKMSVDIHNNNFLYGFYIINQQVDLYFNNSKKTRDLIISNLLNDFLLNKANEKQIDRYKNQFYLYIFLNMLFYDTYDKINSSFKNKKAYHGFDIDLSLICNFFDKNMNRLFIAQFSYDYLILGILEKLFIKDELLVSLLIKKGMNNAKNYLYITVKSFKKFSK